MKVLFTVTISGVPATSLGKLVSFLNGIPGDGYTMTAEKPKPHYSSPRTFKKSTKEDREKMYELSHIHKMSPEMIAKETGFSVPTVLRYIKAK